MMSIGFQIWFVLACGIGLVWLVRLVTIGSVLRRRCVLKPDAFQGPPENVPHVSILVAARDEEDNIESCITTLFDQDYPNFELIVIDDRSRDRTPAILTRLQRQFGDRLRVVTVRECLDGWFGKNHAMHVGVAESHGDWLLFTDADCRQTSPHTLSIAMQEARTHGTDFLSIIPMLESRTAWERILQPACSLVLMIRFLPEQVNDPRKRIAYANGAFMLMTRRCYDAIGGHERVRARLNEDIDMARLVKQRGLRLRVVENEGLYQARMYPTLPAAWRGWSRIFAGAFSSPSRVLAACAVVFLVVLVPWVSLGVALIGRTSGTADAASRWGPAVWTWLSVVILQQLVITRFYAALGIARAWSFTYILGVTVALGMLVNALLKIFGATTTTWRSTTYRGARTIPQSQSASSDLAAGPKPIKEPATPT